MNLLHCIKSTLKLGNYVIKSIDLEKEHTVNQKPYREFTFI